VKAFGDAITAIALLALLALSASITPVAGCVSASGSGAPGVAATPRPAGALTGVLTENQSGLEIQWWTVTDRDEELAQALAPYAEAPTPLPESVRASWRRNGFRMIAVPVRDMAALLGALPIEDKVNRIWLGQTPEWTIAAPGAPWSGERSLRIDGETIRLGGGQIRMLVRAWVSPTEGAPTLRADIAVQYCNAANSAAALAPFARATIRRPETEGMIFRSLTAAMELTGDRVYCIIPEDPDIDWAEVSRGVEDGVASRGPDARARATGGGPALPLREASPFAEPESPDAALALGPAPPGIPLLADALLSRIELLPTRRRARSLVILAPSVPGVFRLAPPAPTGGASTPR
jgi:hypothetical protein